jgi:transcription initiation factor TFIIIB Brf1 subunit/transcription initiation factor TFIIB
MARAGSEKQAVRKDTGCRIRKKEKGLGPREAESGNRQTADRERAGAPL